MMLSGPALRTGHPFRGDAELKAFRRAFEDGFKDRLPATVWFFELGSAGGGGEGSSSSGGASYAMASEQDVALAYQALPSANLWRYSIAQRPSGGGPEDQEGLPVVTVHRRDVRRLLQHVLLVKRFRLEIFQPSSASGYVKRVSASPCDLGDVVKDMLFGSAADEDDEGDGPDGGQLHVLRMGPLCSILIKAPPPGMGGGGGASSSSTSSSPGLPKVGLALWHQATKSASMAEFFDNASLDVLESMLIQHSPMECVLQQGPGHGGGQLGKALESVLERNRVLLAAAAPSQQQEGGGPRRIKAADLDKAQAEVVRKFEADKMASNLKEVPLGIRALALLNMHLAAKGSSCISAADGVSSVKVLDPSEHVQFNNQADLGLNIFSTGLEGNLGSSGHYGLSLFKLLNRTRTSGGDRLLRVWLRQPLTDKEKICERLDTVERLVEDVTLRKTLHEGCLRKIPDFESLALKIAEAKAGLGDLYKTYLGLKEARRVAEELEAGDGGKASSSILAEGFGRPLDNKLAKTEKFLELMEATLDMEAASSSHHHDQQQKFLVKADFDSELQELRGRLDRLRAGIEKSLGRVADTLDLDKKNVKLEVSGQHGYCFRVTMKDEKSLRRRPDVYVVDTSKAGVRFRNGDLERLNKEFLEVSALYEEQQGYVVREILKIAAGYCPFLVDLGRICSRLDCLVAFAVAAESATVPYVKPEILPRKASSGPRRHPQVLQLRAARHPCLEQHMAASTSTGTSACFIPNDAEFGGASSGSFCVITGPNLGGKSTYLRTVALNTIMAQVGSFVACESAQITPVDKVLVRIGAGDSQLTGVSTFMAEMLEASHIVRSATPHSLVLIDELGRGTSTYDGLGLAWAISHYLASEVGATTLFATHFHEVTRLADEFPDLVFNRHVDAIANDSEFTLLYNVRPGGSNKSFGIEVAKLAGFPKEVIDDAKVYLEQAEMPLLRSTYCTTGVGGAAEAGGFAQEVKEFLRDWRDESLDRKRKSELLEEMRAKVGKLIAASSS